MDELKVDLKSETYTQLTVTIKDYEGIVRTVTLRESGWDHGIESLHKMWVRLLAGMGFAGDTIEHFYDLDGEADMCKLEAEISSEVINQFPDDEKPRGHE